ncbi:MAG: hypothetical protein AB1564_03510 [Chloroflexota bacterium]
MPQIKARSASGAVPARPGAYTKFSAKLTGSLDQISDMINDNAAMIDSIQEVALELTNSIGTLHTLTVRYAGIANAILDALLPIVRNLPLIPKNVTAMLVNLESITQKIIDNQASTSKTIGDVQIGLKTGDIDRLKGHAGELQAVTRSLSAILPK